MPRATAERPSGPGRSSLVRRAVPPTLASGLGGSAPNVGIGVGSWTAGIALTSPLGQAGPPLVGTVAATLTLVPLTALALTHATRDAAASVS